MRDLYSSSWKLPLFSGLLLFAAYFTATLVPNFVMFLPVLAWLDGNRRATARERLGAGFVFGCVAYALNLHWMYSMLDVSPLAALLYVGLMLVFAVGIMLSIAVLGWMRRWTGLTFGLLLPACWIPVEWARTWGDMRMTADHVAHSMAKFPFLVQFADLLGPFGVAIFILATNGLLFDAFLGPGRARRRCALTLVLLLGSVLAYDAWAWTRDRSGERSVRIGIVQPNIPLRVKWDSSTAGEQYEILARLTSEAASRGAELVVWPESARPRPLYHYPWMDLTYRIEEEEELARTLGVSLLVGAEYATMHQEDEDYELYNAAFAVHPDGSLDRKWAAKIYLVPFVEAVPWKPVLGWLLKDRGGEWRWVAGTFDPGPGPTVLPFGDLPVGVMVCYEELYYDLARSLRNRGAAIQAVITNDAWFGRSLFQRYQADVLRMRAIENRTSIVRAANTGISGFVDPRGAYLEMGGLFEEKVLVQDLPLAGARTVYDRIGDVAAWAVLAAFAALTVWTYRSKRSSAAGHGGTGSG